MPLDLVSLIVDDYDAAIEFFTGPLGFVLSEDSPSVTTDGRPKRWVVVRPADGGTGLVLARADGDEQSAFVGRQFAGRVGLFLRVEDFDGTLASIQDSGCDVVRPVRDEAYGRVCVFRDPWGNLWDLLGSRAVAADMSDASVPRDPLRVTTCDTDETLAVASGLFNQYRHHYGEPPDGDERTLGWLTDMVHSNLLTVYTAALDSPTGAPPIGLATGHAVPASLVMGRFWQLRDLYVLPGSRRQGAASALVSAVREAALAAGATRLSLMTEADNQAALGLYRRLGFRPVEGLASLSLDLAPQPIR